jgi:hypothetical protein
MTVLDVVVSIDAAAVDVAVFLARGVAPRRRREQAKGRIALGGVGFAGKLDRLVQVEVVARQLGVG